MSNLDEIRALADLESALVLIGRASQNAASTISYSEAVNIIREQLAVAEKALTKIGGPEIEAIK